MESGLRCRLGQFHCPKKPGTREKDRSTLEGSSQALIHTIETLIRKHVPTWMKEHTAPTTSKQAKNAIPTRGNRQVIDRQHRKTPVPSFALLCGRSYPYLPWEKTVTLENGSEKVPWRETRRRKGRMRWDVVEEELQYCPGYRESGICDHAKERVVFSFFFFLALRCAGVFGSQQGPWLQFWLPLVVPKCGRFPLSLTPMHKLSDGR